MSSSVHQEKTEVRNCLAGWRTPIREEQHKGKKACLAKNERGGDPQHSEKGEKLEKGNMCAVIKSAEYDRFSEEWGLALTWPK